MHKEITTLFSRLTSTPLFNTAGTASTWPFPQRTCSIDSPCIHMNIKTPCILLVWQNINPNRKRMQESQFLWGCIRKRVQGRNEALRISGPSQVKQLPWHQEVVRQDKNLRQKFMILLSFWISKQINLFIGTLYKECHRISIDSIAALLVSRATSRGVLPF